MDDHLTHHWSEGLSSVIFAINTRTSHITKKTPYQLVFGQEPRADYHYWKALNDAAANYDIEMDDMIIDRIESSVNEEVAKQSEVLLDSTHLDDQSG